MFDSNGHMQPVMSLLFVCMCKSLSNSAPVNFFVSLARSIRLLPLINCGSECRGFGKVGGEDGSAVLYIFSRGGK